MNDRQEFDYQKRAKAIVTAVLRTVVALYMIFLGYKLIQGVRSGNSSIAPWVGWVVGLLFFALALAFGVYIAYRYRIDRLDSMLPPPKEEEPETDAPAELPETDTEDDAPGDES